MNQSLPLPSDAYYAVPHAGVTGRWIGQNSQASIISVAEFVDDLGYTWVEPKNLLERQARKVIHSIAARLFVYGLPDDLFTVDVSIPLIRVREGRESEVWELIVLALSSTHRQQVHFYSWRRQNVQQTGAIMCYFTEDC